MVGYGMHGRVRPSAARARTTSSGAPSATVAGRPNPRRPNMPILVLLVVHGLTQLVASLVGAQVLGQSRVRSPRTSSAFGSGS
eukprot:1439677-Pyramimonas_sp.AAC.1